MSRRGSADDDDVASEVGDRVIPFDEVQRKQAVENAKRTAAANAAEIVTAARPAWFARLDMGRDGPYNIHYNAERMLAIDQKYAGRIRFNLMSMEVETRDIPGKPTDGKWESWADDDSLNAAYYAQTYGARLTENTCFKGAKQVALRHQVHPVMDYLEAAPWDGRSHIDRWLTTYCGADDNAYTRAVGAKWMIAAVARIYEPGCQADNMLVLEGEQGIGKTSVARILARTKNWFSSDLPDMRSKDAMQSLQGKWIIEIAELAAVTRTSNEDLKNFVSKTHDHFRAPYERLPRTVARHCILIGTTNSDDWVTDESGARRFWFIKCHKVDKGALIDDVDMLWAEALARYRRGEKWWLSASEETEAKEEQHQRVQIDPWQDLIGDWADKNSDRPFSTDDVYKECLLIAGEKQIGVNANVDVLRFSGQVDPRAIAPGNTVTSTQIANVRVMQRGRGQAAEAQSIGWLGRFFLNVLPI